MKAKQSKPNQAKPNQSKPNQTSSYKPQLEVEVQSCLDSLSVVVLMKTMCGFPWKCDESEAKQNEAKRSKVVQSYCVASVCPPHRKYVLSFH
jgi:hypothetical protein